MPSSLVNPCWGYLSPNRSALPRSCSPIFPQAFSWIVACFVACSLKRHQPRDKAKALGTEPMQIDDLQTRAEQSPSRMRLLCERRRSAGKLIQHSSSLASVICDARLCSPKRSQKGPHCTAGVSRLLPPLPATSAAGLAPPWTTLFGLVLLGCCCCRWLRLRSPRLSGPSALL